MRLTRNHEVNMNHIQPIFGVFQNIINFQLVFFFSLCLLFNIREIWPRPIWVQAAGRSAATVKHTWRCSQQRGGRGHWWHGIGPTYSYGSYGHELICLTMQNRLVLKATFSATKRRSWLGKKLVRFLSWTNLIVAISTKQSKISNVRLEKKSCNITKIPDFALRAYLPGLILLWSLGAPDFRRSQIHQSFAYQFPLDFLWLYNIANVYCILKNII